MTRRLLEQAVSERTAELGFNGRDHAVERPVHTGKPQTADALAVPLERDVPGLHAGRGDECRA